MRNLAVFSVVLAGAMAAPAADPLKDPVRPIAASASLPAPEAARAMKLPPGFTVQVVAHEPEISQPIAICLDERGRVWVLENSNYPKAPGEPKDRIVILEDKDGDGRAETQKVFIDNLTFSSGLAKGFGGVWVGSPPNLLFIPDRNGDDIPDGAPEVKLDGWGREDTHETLNNFIWGPDGWLYGTQGVFTHSRVGKPGTPKEERVPINAGVWRYHPVDGRFERYSEGGSNQWGIDWNDHGQAFYAACVIPHIWQCIQGARYHRQAGSHFHPHIYEDIKTIGDFEYEKRAYCGAMIYLGDAFPSEYRNTFFFGDIHMNKLRNEAMERRGSGYRAVRRPEFLVAHDAWFRGVSMMYGPDGAVYLCDWYDKVPCYQQREFVDRGNGRIYKIVPPGPSPAAGVDLAAMSSLELVKLQAHKNDWFVRHARRLLQERGPDPAVHAALAAMLRDHSEETRKLRALWALHSTGGLTPDLGLELLKSPHEYVRAWAVQLLCEKGQPSPVLLEELARLAQSDASPVVRLYLASAAQRIDLAARWPLVEALTMRGEDALDQNLPLMIWYAAEPLVAADPARGAKLLAQSRIPRLQELISRRIAALALP